MARIYEATLTPSKIDAITPWLAEQSWFLGDHRSIEIIGAYRFDDPDGEVGIESMLLRAPGTGAATWHVPLSYRGAPLVGADEFLICTMEHSVLGPRWVYNAVGDPVYRAELARTIVHADTEAQRFLEVANELRELPVDTRVHGSGISVDSVPDFSVASIVEAADSDEVTVIDAGLARLAVTRRIGGAALAELVSSRDAGLLTGHWPGQDVPLPLAALELTPVG